MGDDMCNRKGKFKKFSKFSKIENLFLTYKLNRVILKIDKTSIKYVFK